MNTITIDTGTTNTRVCLWSNFEFVASAKRPVGVRNTSMDGDNQKITEGIADAFKELLEQQNINEKDIDLVLASGMITSNLGLTEVPHLIAPASLVDFSKNIHIQTIPKVCSLPIYFIPGLKNPANVNDGPIEARDVMRGEEVETLALLNLTRTNKAVTFFLPGSHTKYVAVNNQQEITGCCTTLAGELTSAVTHNTILTGSLQNSFTDALDNEYLLKGAESCKKVGLTRSLFSTRILEQTTETTQNQLASFLLGMIISEDIRALLRSESLNFSDSHQVGIYGDSTVSQAFKILLDASHPKIKNYMIDEDISENLSGFGCLLVAASAGLLK